MKVWSVELEARIAEIDTEDGYCYSIVDKVLQCCAEDCINCEYFDCILHLASR